MIVDRKTTVAVMEIRTGRVQYVSLRKAATFLGVSSAYVYRKIEIGNVAQKKGWAVGSVERGKEWERNYARRSE